MTNDAAERLRRLLSVIPIFAEGESITRADLERRTGVDTDVLLEDLRVVTERLDAPGGFVEDLRVQVEADRISVHSSHFMRPVRITAPELCALELGLAMLRTCTPPDDCAPITRVRGKIRNAIVELPADGSESWHSVSPAVPDDYGLAILARGIRECIKVRIAYQGGSATEFSERVIHPYYIVFSRGGWFVVGHCERSGALRFFRADRIRSAELTGDSFPRPDVPSIDDLFPAGKAFQVAAQEELVVKYSPRVARWIAEREGGTPDSDGYLTMRHRLGDDHWAMRHVLQYGAEAEVISPPRIRKQLADTLRRLIA